LIEVHEDVMTDRVAAARESLLAERDSGVGTPGEYLGAAMVFVDETLARLAAVAGSRG
jgi:hypothetical protein